MKHVINGKVIHEGPDIELGDVEYTDEKGRKWLLVGAKITEIKTTYEANGLEVVSAPVTFVRRIGVADENVWGELAKDIFVLPAPARAEPAVLFTPPAKEGDEPEPTNNCPPDCDVPGTFCGVAGKCPFLPHTEEK